MSDGADRNGGDGSARRRQYADGAGAPRGARRHHPQGLPRRRRGQRGRARGGRGLPGTDGVGGDGARPSRPGPAARRLPADVHGPVHRPPRRGGPARRSRSTGRRRRGPTTCTPPRAAPASTPASSDTGEKYDCVIVGAGRAGSRPRSTTAIASARASRILIVDALPDFGGHSHRNEWHIRNAAAGQRRRDDPAQRRHREPRQPRHLEPGRAGRGSRAPTASRPSTSSTGRASTSSRRRSGRTVAPPAFRPRSASTSGCSSPPRTSAPTTCSPRATPARSPALELATEEGWTAFLDRTPYSQAAKEAILQVQTADEDFLANAPGAPLTPERARVSHDDHLQAVPARPRRRERRGVPRRVLARLGRPARRRRPGRLRRRLLDPRPPRVPGRRGARRHRGRRPRRHRPHPVPGLALDEHHPVARVAGRQHVAAPARPEQADPERVPGRERRRRPEAPGPAEHPQGDLPLRPARPAVERASRAAQRDGVQRRAGASAATTRPSTTCSTRCPGQPGKHLGTRGGPARLGQARDHGLLEPGHGAHRRRPAPATSSRASATPARSRSCTAASACATGRRSPTPRSRA